MRKGQLLSLDAMLSMVIIILLLGTITTTSSALKGEITTVLGWYERANVGDNMLDILVKNPGVPQNWFKNPSTASLVGLRDSSYPFAVSSEKISALSLYNNISSLVSSLYNISTGKDFHLEFYLTSANISVSGEFPEKIFMNLTSELQNIRIALSTDSSGNRPFQVECNSVLLNNEPAPTGNAIELNPGDVLEFVPLEDAQVLVQGNTREGIIPSNSYVVVKVIETRSNYQYSLTSSGGICSLHIGGQGQVKLIIYGNSAGTLRIGHVVIPATNLTTASIGITVINGTAVEDNDTMTASMSRSPWVEYISRRVVSSELLYKRTMTIGTDAPQQILVGTLLYNVPTYSYLEIKVPYNSAGNLTLVAIDGTLPKGILVQKSPGGVLNATIAWKSSDRTYAEFYTGNSTAILIPWGSIFSPFNPETGEKPVELWVYENNFGANITIKDMDNIGLLMKPSFRPTVIKLWVWDDS